MCCDVIGKAPFIPSVALLDAFSFPHCWSRMSRVVVPYGVQVPRPPFDDANVFSKPAYMYRTQEAEEHSEVSESIT